MMMSLRKGCFFHHLAMKIRVRVMKSRTLILKKVNHKNKTNHFNSLKTNVKCTLCLLLLSLIHSRQNPNKK